MLLQGLCGCKLAQFLAKLSLSAEPGSVNGESIARLAGMIAALCAAVGIARNGKLLRPAIAAAKNVPAVFKDWLKRRDTHEAVKQLVDTVAEGFKSDLGSVQGDFGRMIVDMAPVAVAQVDGVARSWQDIVGDEKTDLSAIRSQHKEELRCVRSEFDARN